MNAKKIMGAVLVALLAAALFVGAGAADDKGTYFVYQQNDGLKLLNGTWTNGAASVVIDTDGALLPVGDFVAGTYTKGKDTIYVTYPTASYKLSAKYGTEYYLVVNGGNVYNLSFINLTAAPLANGVQIEEYLLTKGSETPVKGSIEWVNAEKQIKSTGTYKVQAIFKTDGFVQGVPANLLLDANSFTFKVVKADEATLSASVDTLYAGEKVTLTVAGTPGEKYNVTGTNLTITNNQLITVTPTGDGNYTFTMPNTGKASFVAKINESAKKEVIIKLIYNGKYVKDEEVKIKISAPVVTATLGAPSYFIGEKIVVTGTASAKMDFTFNISGTNIKEFTLNDDLEQGKNWKANLTVPVDKKLDVGTYTIKVKTTDGKTVATLAVALKQPFISIAEAPEIVGQGEAATFLINAEAATDVQAYFFGTNYFNVVDAVPELDEDDEPIANLFNVTLTEDETNKSKMATGQYFAVFQHPMYDKAFNIGADENNGKVYQNNNGNWTDVIGNDENVIFNAKERQTANAAQALCDALDSQLIDDMYVKYSFFVVADLQKDTFSMSEIPSEVVKGDKIVITGVDTANKEKTVTVEMISTAFAAVPKETVGSAAFIVATTEIAEDGTWEITLDTSDLNVDEYSLSVAIAGAEKENVKVNVVEGSEPVTPTDEPTVVPTDEPVTPTEAPATPGFGALAALAGLGAVAVLLLRRE